MTKDGIEYNLLISPYIVEIKYEDKYLNFMFSSELYKNKFINMRAAHNERIVERLKKLTKSNLEIKEFNIYSDITLYNMIEKRGFLIIENIDKFYYGIEDFNLKLIC